MLNLFEESRVRHVSSIESDHCFIVIKLREINNHTHNKGVKQFRYENVWQSHADYDDLVNESWQRLNQGQGLAGIACTLSKMQGELGAWGAKEFGNLSKTVKTLQKKIERLRRHAVGRGPSPEELATAQKLREALNQEVWLRQRSRVRWLRAGDRNTAHFQAQAKQRKRMNRIVGLKRLDGSVCVDSEEDKVEVQEFYQQLYTSQGFQNMDGLLQFVPERVTPIMNDDLQRPFEAAEVRTALFQMAPSKAPGVDGFTAGFFQRHS